MRSDTHRIALRAIRAILAPAQPRQPFEVRVGSLTVTCQPSPAPPSPWPTSATGLTEALDQPWPSPLPIDCTWPNGRCRLEVTLHRWTSGKYKDDLCLDVYTSEGREVVFVNVSHAVEDAVDGATVPLAVRFFVSGRNRIVSDDLIAALNVGLQAVLADSQLPIRGASTAELCKVEVPSGAVLPAPETVLHRLVRLAMMKLDFIDHAQVGTRGAPLIDLSTWVKPELLTGLPPLGGNDDERADRPNYWAAGFSEPDRLQAFKSGNLWQMGWKRTSAKNAAQVAWKYFDGIKVGDRLAIKGLGGAHDLRVHYVGEVAGIDRAVGRLP
jgi:hypothetical protein